MKFAQAIVLVTLMGGCNANDTGVLNATSAIDFAHVDQDLAQLDKVMETPEYAASFTRLKSLGALAGQAAISEALQDRPEFLRMLNAIKTPEAEAGLLAFQKKYVSPQAYFEAEGIPQGKFTKSEYVMAVLAGQKLLQGDFSSELTPAQNGRVTYISTVVRAALLAKKKTSSGLALAGGCGDSYSRSGQCREYDTLVYAASGAGRSSVTVTRSAPGGKVTGVTCQAGEHTSQTVNNSITYDKCGEFETVISRNDENHDSIVIRDGSHKPIYSDNSREHNSSGT